MINTEQFQHEPTTYDLREENKRLRKALCELTAESRKVWDNGWKFDNWSSFLKALWKAEDTLSE